MITTVSIIRTSGRKLEEMGGSFFKKDKKGTVLEKSLSARLMCVLRWLADVNLVFLQEVKVFYFKARTDR